MNLAEASAALGKKDAERAGLKEEKYKLQVSIFLAIFLIQFIALCVYCLI